MESNSNSSAKFDSAALRATLERVLASKAFRSSKRCQDFLRYVVEQTIAGRGEDLKERTIGIEVFGRGSDYDPSASATVRVRAIEVRKRLDEYYAREGEQDPIRIEIPTGTYLPLFQPHWPAAAVSIAPVKTLAGPRRLRLAALALLTAAGLGTIWLLSRGSAAPAETGALAAFWAPLVRTGTPTLLVGSALPIYSLDHSPLSSAPVRVSDFVRIPDQYMAVGDIESIERVATYFNLQHHASAIRIVPHWSFDRLRERPAVLVGYTYTFWNQISDRLRYVLHVAGPPFGVLDRGQPTAWHLDTLPNDPKLDEDYGLISRVYDPDTHSMLIELSGISRLGTEAAADFVTNPSLFNEALRGAPANWMSRNLQVVIHVRNVAGSPSAPTVVATFFGQPFRQNAGGQ